MGAAPRHPPHHPRRRPRARRCVSPTPRRRCLCDACSLRAPLPRGAAKDAFGRPPHCTWQVALQRTASMVLLYQRALQEGTAAEVPRRLRTSTSSHGVASHRAVGTSHGVASHGVASASHGVASHRVARRRDGAWALRLRHHVHHLLRRCTPDGASVCILLVLLVAPCASLVDVVPHASPHLVPSRNQPTRRNGRSRHHPALARHGLRARGLRGRGRCGRGRRGRGRRGRRGNPRLLHLRRRGHLRCTWHLRRRGPLVASGLTAAW